MVEPLDSTGHAPARGTYTGAQGVSTARPTLPSSSGLVTLAEIYGTDQPSAEDAYLDHRRSNIHLVSYRRDDGSFAPFTARTTAMARHFPYVVVNNATYLNFMTFDVDDKADARPAVARIESFIADFDVTGWITLTPNGAHFGTFVDHVPTFNLKAVGFYLDIWSNINRLVAGDRSYGRHSTRNPLNHPTRWPGSTVYTLRDLHSALAPGWVKVNPLDALRLGQAGEGRNASLFTRLLQEDCSDRKALLVQAHKINTTFEEPLPEHEVRSVVRSVLRRKLNGEGYGRALLREMASHGGSAGSEAQTAARNASINEVNRRKADQAAYRALQARQLRQQGASLREIAHALGVARSTVQRYLTG